MRYHFVDKILRLAYNHEIVTVKNVTASEDYFEDHFVGNPVMPGAIQIETIAQACGALIEISSDYRRFSILLMVEKMKFKKIIRPGDRLIVTAAVVSMHPESALFDTKIELDGAVVTTGQIVVGITTSETEGGSYAKAIETLRAYFKPLLQGAEIRT